VHVEEADLRVVQREEILRRVQGKNEARWKDAKRWVRNSGKQACRKRRATISSRAFIQ
jgi:hypothetical protein